MADRLPNQTTTVTQQELLTALGCAWLELFGSRPEKAQLLVAMSQWALETGWGKYMHCYNIGNVKSREGDGRDYTYFKCWEIFNKTYAEKLVARDTSGLVEIEEGSEVNGNVKVWFSPDHPTCRFRAYKTLELGATDYLHKLMVRFSDDYPEKDAWSALLRGEPKEFSQALKQKGYYTAPEAAYTKGLTSIFALLSAKPFDMETIPYFTEAQRTELSNWRQISMLQHYNNEDDPGDPDASS